MIAMPSALRHPLDSFYFNATHTTVTPLTHAVSVCLGSPVNDKPSLLARIALWFGAFAFVAAIVGPLFAHFEIVRPMVGFAVLLVGLLDALIAMVCGAIAFFRGGAESRGTALGGIIPSLLVLAAVAFSASRGAGPRINDITTDTQNPPEFVQAARLEENRERDMTYPGESFASQQRDGYPDLAPLRLSQSPEEAFAKAYEAAKQVDSWEITHADPGTRIIEGIDTTWLFRFADDFIIQIRPADEGGGSIVQMRSKSRDGKSDMGANAARIKGFFAAISG